jgi:antitoxin component YwqK of YwqJK toxin-antitoxin module
MKKLLLLTLVLIASNFAFGQNTFTRYVYSETEYLLEERCPEGRLVQTTEADNSFKTMKMYYPCGKVQAVGYTMNGKKVGKWTYYTSTGDIVLVLTFRNNKLIRYDKRLDRPNDLFAIR